MKPFFSLCIPQYNRTDFLIAALESYRAQTFRDFEVCISDGGSTDGGLARLETYLQSSGLRYVLGRSQVNLRYDPNLRKCIALSSGRYLWLMGNDDALAEQETLAQVRGDLVTHEPVAVAISNYLDLPTGQVYRRMRKTGVIDGGAMSAAKSFRHYAFVGGVILDGDAARAIPTDRVDGSEMYQMYLGAKLIADDGRFLQIDRITVHKDVQLPDQTVDSYRDRPKESHWVLKERPLPMGRILQAIACGLDRSATRREERRRAVAAAALQLYSYTYPFWIFEYRRVQSYAYALGVYGALRPSRVMAGLNIGLVDRLRAWAIWSVIGLVGFITPVLIFDWLRPTIYRFAKRPRRAGEDGAALLATI